MRKSPLGEPGRVGPEPVDPVQRVHGLEGGADRSARDGRADQEQADQGGQGIAIAGTSQQPRTIERPEGQLDHLLGTEPLGNVGFIETRPVQNLAHPVNRVGLGERERARA